MTEKINNNYEPFGMVLGYAPGDVPIYSNCRNGIKDRNDSQICSKSYIGSFYTGKKWDSVEFVRRFLYINYNIIFPEVRFAHDIFSLRFLYHVLHDKMIPLAAFPNGSKQQPVALSLLIWDATGQFAENGHAAIISEVFNDKIRIVEQSVTNMLLPKDKKWTRELKLKFKDGKYYVDDTFENTKILGWMIQSKTNYDESLIQSAVSGDYLVIKHETIENKGQFNDWLRSNNHLENAYLQVHHGQANNGGNQEYFTISDKAEKELIRATNELHFMFMHATDIVINNDKLLRLFNFPESLWECIRKSWQKRRHQMITGRMDFSMDKRGLKLYEYNADSSSCHTESAIVIERWIKQSGIKLGYNPSKKLRESVTEAWKYSDAKPFVHILKDNVSEEGYHALFMQDALKQAGHKSKIVHGLNELQWNDNGFLVDADGVQINCVWKTWAWETALEQLRTESEQTILHTSKRTCRQVRLLDVLTNPNINVFEPLWTYIPSNKAILPILWQLFPNHPFLLYTDYKLNERMKKSGYVVKPIGGRCGSNISMVNGNGQLLYESTGHFEKQNNVYQELWSLPKIAGRYLQTSTFTAAGKYCGACLRSDTSLIINYDSFIQPLIVIPERK